MIENTLVISQLITNSYWASQLKHKELIAETSTLKTLVANQSRYIESERLQQLFNEVTTGIKLTGLAKPNLQLAINCLLNACFEAIDSLSGDYEVGVLWRTSTSGEKQTRYTSKLFSPKTRKKAADLLEENGYIKFFKGGYNSSRLGNGKISLAWPTAKLYSLYEEVVASSFTVKQAEGVDRELIILKGSVTSDSDASNSYDEKFKYSTYVEYVDNDSTNHQRSVLQNVNKLNQSFNWIYTNHDGVQERLHPWSLTLKRQFLEGSFNVYGRIHCGAQGLKAAKRFSLTIDGEDTAELDYSGMLLSLAYASLKEPLPAGDPYELSGYRRKLVKKAFMICMNTASRRSAIQALSGQKALLDIPDVEILGASRVAEDVICKLERKHPEVAEWHFYTAAWKSLTLSESNLMMGILALCEAYTIPILPIHDGIVCRQVDKEIVAGFMIGEFKRLYELEPNLTEVTSVNGNSKPFMPSSSPPA